MRMSTLRSHRRWLQAMPFALVPSIMLVVSTGGAKAAFGGDEHDLAHVTFLSASDEAFQLRVEIADTPELTACGLMHRTFLPEDQGMLFIYESTSGFWNRNTLIPLSVAYIDRDGRIVDILPMEATPYPGAPGVSQRDPREPYSYVIEANAGWFDRHGISIGDRVDLADAIARGSDGQSPPLCRERGY